MDFHCNSKPTKKENDGGREKRFLSLNVRPNPLHPLMSSFVHPHPSFPLFRRLTHMFLSPPMIPPMLWTVPSTTGSTCKQLMNSEALTSPRTISTDETPHPEVASMTPHQPAVAILHGNVRDSTKPARHRGDCARDAKKVSSPAASGRPPLQRSREPKLARHIEPQRSDWCRPSNERVHEWTPPLSPPSCSAPKVGRKSLATAPTSKLPIRESSHARLQDYLEVNNYCKDKDSGNEVGKIWQILTIEGFTQTTHFICSGGQQMEESNDCSFKFSSWKKRQDISFSGMSLRTEGPEISSGYYHHDLWLLS